MKKEEKCSKCGNVRYIVNRKYRLCQPCNYERLHGEGSLEQKQREAAHRLIQSRKPVRRKSSRQREADAELARVYEEMARTREMVCTGCGTTRHLSHSHIIRRSWNKAFETVPENITYHCLVRPDGSKGCHDRWEDTAERVFLRDYEQNMAYIKSVDPTLYWQIFYREKDLGLR